MITPEEQQAMVKDTRRSSEEIIPILLKILTDQPQSVSRLSSGSKELDDYLSSETIERHLKLLLQIQELLWDKHLFYKEKTIGGRVYKEAWLEEQEQ